MISENDVLKQIQNIINDSTLTQSQTINQIRNLLGTVSNPSSVLSSLTGLLNGNLSNFSSIIQSIGSIVQNNIVSEIEQIFHNFSDIKTLLDKQVGNMKSVTVVGDGSMRGSQGSDSSSSLIITRDGKVKGSINGQNVTITLESGSADWDGALRQENVEPYYTRAQLSTLRSMMKYIKTMSEATITNNSYSGSLPVSAVLPPTRPPATDAQAQSGPGV